MSPSTELILNANARKLRQGNLFDEIRRTAAPKARVWVTNDLGELRQLCADVAARSPTRVILCGGDGSFMAGISALHEAFGPSPLPEIGLIAAGTVASVVRNWGRPEAPLRSLQRMLAATGLSETPLRPTLRVADDAQTRIGFTFGTGLVARFFERYYQAGGDGLWTAARIVGRVFVGSFVSDTYAQSVLTPLPCRLIVDGRELSPRAFSLVACSVLRDLGLHLLVTYRAGEAQDRVHLVAAPLSPQALGPQAPRVLLGRRLRGPDVFDDLVRSWSLQFDEQGPYVLDGDIFSAAVVTVSPGPELRILV